MSTLAILTRRTVSAVPRGAAVAARSMTGGSNMHGNDPEVIEKAMKREKHHNDTHEHAPGWSETLASESEAHVKADSHKGTIDVKKTIEQIKKQHSDDPSATTSKSLRGANPLQVEHDSLADSSDKDTVGGPLGRAS